MFGKLFGKLVDWNAELLCQAVLATLAGLQGVFCLPPGSSHWARALLRFGAIHLEGRIWALLLRYINWASGGIKCIAILQAIAIAATAYYANFCTPHGAAHLAGATLINLFAGIATLGVVRDAWKMQGDIERSAMMRTYRLIE